jgi:hypothetical protein
VVALVAECLGGEDRRAAEGRDRAGRADAEAAAVGLQGRQALRKKVVINRHGSEQSWLLAAKSWP